MKQFIEDFCLNLTCFFGHVGITWECKPVQEPVAIPESSNATGMVGVQPGNGSSS